MTLVPKIIHFIYPVWANTRPLSYVNEVAVKLARKYHPDYQIKFWLSGTPTPNQHWDTIQKLVEICLFDAPTEWEGDKIEWPQYSSDVARLVILQREGGIYMDTDMLCLKPLDRWLGDKLVMCWEDATYKRSISNAMIISPPDSRFLGHWRMRIGDAMKEEWAVGGVVLPARIWNKNEDKFKNEVDIVEHFNFCPLNLSRNWMFENLYYNSALEQIKESYAVHVFETYWRDIIKNVTPEWCKTNKCLFSEIASTL